MKRARTSSPNQPEDIRRRPCRLAQAPGGARCAAMRSPPSRSLHALERLALGHLDGSDAVGLGGLERRVEALHGAGDEVSFAASLIALLRKRQAVPGAQRAPFPLERHVNQTAAVGEEV